MSHNVFVPLADHEAYAGEIIFDKYGHSGSHIVKGKSKYSFPTFLLIEIS